MELKSPLLGIPWVASLFEVLYPDWKNIRTFSKAMSVLVAHILDITTPVPNWWMWDCGLSTIGKNVNLFSNCPCQTHNKTKDFPLNQPFCTSCQWRKVFNGSKKSLLWLQGKITMFLTFQLVFKNTMNAFKI